MVRNLLFIVVTGGIGDQLIAPATRVHDEPGATNLVEPTSLTKLDLSYE